MRLVECVPNFSDGRNERVINAISDSIRAVQGVNLLDVDPGYSTNRTVITFVGGPEEVVEAAFQAIATAANLIDMRRHKGEHPRMGATDVCPFIPVAGVTMQDCVKLAEQLGERVGKELKIPVYLYSEAARKKERQSLADIRKGEYEALPEKMKDPDFKPDFGPSQFNAQSGATVIGARPFLIAYNVDLNTKSKKLANDIALSIREAGRNKKDERGEIVRDGDGKPVKLPGRLKACRAVGWYVDEYQRAQVSINLLDFEQTSLHQAFDEVCLEAERLGLRVTGSEIVGMVPLKPMLMAGRHYLERQGRCTGVPESELINTAIQSLGLNDVAPFDPQRKIIEYKVSAGHDKRLVNRTVSSFLDELSCESAAPGGGSVAALCGALSAGLTSMVAALSFDKKGFAEKKPLLNDLAEKAQKLKASFAAAIDDDMNAFNAVIDAGRLPKASEEEIKLRNAAIVDANKKATLIPLGVLRLSKDAVELAMQVAASGNPNSLSDAGVAGLTALSAAEGAYYNVLINLGGFKSEWDQKAFEKETRKEADDIVKSVRDLAEKLRADVLDQLSGSLVEAK